MRAAILPLTMSEADFQSTVIDLARRLGWRVCHFHATRLPGGRVITPVQGDVGAPDLILARDGVVILAELKRHGAKPRPAQVEWLTALGAYGRLWTPMQWPAIVAELRGARPDDEEQR
jgi:hypothetical protein